MAIAYAHDSLFQRAEEAFKKAKNLDSRGPITQYNYEYFKKFYLSEKPIPTLELLRWKKERMEAQKEETLKFQRSLWERLKNLPPTLASETTPSAPMHPPKVEINE
jgi:hypothetical protein